MRIALRIILIIGMISFACLATAIYLEQMDHSLGTPLSFGFRGFAPPEGIWFFTIGMMTAIITLIGLTTIGLIRFFQRISRRT